MIRMARQGSSVSALLVAALLIFLGLTDSAIAAEQNLIDALRQGGHVIYFRHAPTEWSQSDQVQGPDDWRSCDPQRMRQLSDAGRALAKRVGAAIRQRGIPVGAVFASEYCRCVETARLLDLGPVETTRDILNARAADYIGGRESLTRTVRRRFATPPPPGTNTVLVGHGNVFLLVADPRPTEAGAAIIKPDGQGSFTVIAMLGPEEWANGDDAVR